MSIWGISAKSYNSVRINAHLRVRPFDDFTLGNSQGPVEPNFEDSKTQDYESKDLSQEGEVELSGRSG